MSGAPGSFLNGVSWKDGDSREKGKIIVELIFTTPEAVDCS